MLGEHFMKGAAPPQESSGGCRWVGWCPERVRQHPVSAGLSEDASSPGELALPRHRGSTSARGLGPVSVWLRRCVQTRTSGPRVQGPGLRWRAPLPGLRLLWFPIPWESGLSNWGCFSAHHTSHRSLGRGGAGCAFPGAFSEVTGWGGGEQLANQLAVLLTRRFQGRNVSLFKRVVCLLRCTRWRGLDWARLLDVSCSPWLIS